MKIVTRLLLTCVIVALGYLVYESVMSTVRFDNKVDFRYEQTVKKMKDIREAQRFYKIAHGAYAVNFDTLVNYVNNDSIPIIKIIPDPEDTTFVRVIRDTLGSLSVYDSLFGKRENYLFTEISIIPSSEGALFQMISDTIKKGGVNMPVYEVTASNFDILKGLDEQMIINLNEKATSIDRYPGLKMGSLTEVTTDGNWE